MDITGKKIGIWGLGVAGRAVLHYLINQPCTLTVLDKNGPDPELAQLLNNSNIIALLDEPATRDDFFKSQDIIIPSPGIDLRPYTNYSHKIVPEADLFASIWKKQIISITGTLGKTSITHLLTTLLTNAGISVIAGGNIGIGMLETATSDAEYAILELSSFQLEHCKSFAPDYAIWTNFYPNHLDRHGTMADYYHAKKQILTHQKNSNTALLPLELIETIRLDQDFAHRTFNFFSKQKPSPTELIQLKRNESVYYFDVHGNIIKNSTLLVPAEDIPAVSYKTNWLIILTMIHLLGLEPQKILKHTQNFTLPHYRLEHIATINGISYYNDSKATIMQATVAAVDEIHNGPIILLLGGTSKGVDRTEYIQQLVGKVQKVICFGEEAEKLNKLCEANNILSQTCSTLDEALASARCAEFGTNVLLSPGGASFDLFKNYEERGAYFKSLVLGLYNTPPL